MKHKKQGLFITFEGGEGAGKSTLIQHLIEYFRKQGFDVVYTREPGGTPLGESIRQLLLNGKSGVPICAEAELLLLLSARVQHLDEVIRPSLSEGKVVLCDRFNDSTIAYQGVARGLGYKETQTLCNQVCKGIQPDLTLFLNVEPSVGLNRTRSSSKEHAKSGEVDRIESESLNFHQRVQEGFIKLAEEFPQRIAVLDANRSQADVYSSALKAVENVLKTCGRC